MHRLLAHAPLVGYLSIYLLDKKGGQQQSLADHTATAALSKEATLHEGMHHKIGKLEKQRRQWFTNAGQNIIFLSAMLIPKTDNHRIIAVQWVGYLIGMCNRFGIFC